MRKSISLHSYLSLTNAILILMVLGVIGYIWSRGQQDAIERELQSEVREHALLLATIVSQKYDQNPDLNIDSYQLPADITNADYIVAYLANDLSLHNLGDQPLTVEQSNYFRQYGHTALNGDSNVVRLRWGTRTEESIYASSPVLDHYGKVSGAICVILPLDRLGTQFSRMRLTLLSIVLGVSLIGIIVSFLFTNLITQRVVDAEKLAARVAQGDYQLRLPETGPRELQELATHLNRMAQELQDQTHQRQSLLANVTHELARPLGGLQQGVESLQGGAFKDKELSAELLDNMAQTIRRMELLIDDIGLAAHPTTKPIQLNRTCIQLEPFLRSLVTRSRTAARNHDIEIDFDLPPALPEIYADEKRLNQIMGNLIDNALKFTPREGRINVTVKFPDPEHIQLMVRDSGPGIAAEDAPYIFSPFYQGQAGKRIMQGMGLGLAIARQLAEAHGGSLVLENAPGGGSIAILNLPNKRVLN